MNYLEINANHGDYRILHQVIAKILQCYDKRQGFLLDWSTDMLPVLFHDSHVKRVGWRRCFSFNLETKSSRYILERTRSRTKSLSSDWCQSYETVEVEEIVLISEISKDQDQSHHRLWMQMRNQIITIFELYKIGTEISVEYGTGKMVNWITIPCGH